MNASQIKFGILINCFSRLVFRFEMWLCGISKKRLDLVSNKWALSIQSARAGHVLTNNAGQCSPFPWGNVVLWCGITAKHFDEPVAGVIHQSLHSWSDSHSTHRCKCERDENTKATSTQAMACCFWPWLPRITLAVGELRVLRLSWLLLWKNNIINKVIKETALQYPTWLFTYVPFTILFCQGNESAV